MQRVNFLIKTADKKLIETEAYNTPLIGFPLQNQPLQAAQKHFEHLNLNFADEGNLDGEIHLLIGFGNYWRFLAGEVRFCDREGLVAVNSLFGWMLSGSIKVKSEELVTRNLHLTHVLFSRDIVGYEKINEFRFKDADVLEIKNRSAVNLANADFTKQVNL